MPTFNINTDTFFGFTGATAIALIIFIVVIVYWARDINKFKKFIAFWAWLFSSIFRGASYIAAKNEIEGKLNSFVSTLEAKTGENFPRISIDWATGKKNEKIIWEDFNAIIVIRDKKSRNKNFVHAAYYFVSNALLREAKLNLAKNQKKALNLFTSKKILEEENIFALKQFMSDYFVPEIIDRPQIKELIKSFLNIDNLGIYFPVLIKELSYLGRKVFLEANKGDIIKEVSDLINFFDEYSQRRVGDTDVPLDFRGEYSRCTIRIVASRDQRTIANVDNQAIYVCDAVRSGAENIYIIGSGEKDNKKFIALVEKKVLSQHENLKRISNLNFPAHLNFDSGFRKVNSCLVHLHNPEMVDYLVYKTKKR